jgi:hypothetical protein
VDEETGTGSAGERHNGTGVAGAVPWANGAPLPDRVWSGASAALRPADAPADERRPPTPGGWPAPGLDDVTPAGGLPAVEPPLWREAARRTATISGPPAWTAEPGADGETAGPSSWPLADEVAPRSWPPVDEVAPRSWPPVDDRQVARAAGDLPQRIPSEPDVPALDEPPDHDLPAEAPELARIADQLRRDDVPSGTLTDGFDVEDVLEAVREVTGVRAATLRASPTGAHTLRLDLADDADPVQVSRVVARLLQERMGLSAAPRHAPRQRVSPEGGGHTAPPTWPDGSAPLAGPAEPPPDAAWSPPLPPPQAGTRVVIDHVQVSIVGLNATVEVRLAAGRHRALGLASGPAIDSYVVRLAAVSAAKAVDELMREAGRQPSGAGPPSGDGPPPDDGPSRCHVEHTGVVPFGSTEVAVVVVQLVCGGWVEQLAGSAVVDGDARQAAVRATLGAVNRRLDALLAG